VALDIFFKHFYGLAVSRKNSLPECLSKPPTKKSVPNKTPTFLVCLPKD
jgi:hypothetical protein